MESELTFEQKVVFWTLLGIIIGIVALVVISLLILGFRGQL